MEYKQSDYNEFKDYYLVKLGKEKSLTYLPYWEESLSLAKIVEEGDFYNLYLVRTPVFEGKNLKVVWKTNFLLGDKNNADKKFIPLTDILSGMFQTNENRKDIIFSYFYEHYNIGFGSTILPNINETKLFFELNSDDSYGIKLNYKENISPEFIKKYIKASKIDSKTEDDLNEIFAAIVKELEDKKSITLDRNFQIDAMNFYFDNKKLLNIKSKIALNIIANKHTDLVIKILQNPSAYLLKYNLTARGYDAIATTQFYKQRGLKTRKNKQSVDLMPELDNSLKQEILFGYLEYGKRFLETLKFVGETSEIYAKESAMMNDEVKLLFNYSGKCSKLQREFDKQKQTQI